MLSQSLSVMQHSWTKFKRKLLPSNSKSQNSIVVVDLFCVSAGRCQLARAKCWSLPSTLVTRQTLIEVGQLVSILSPLRTMCVTNASQSSKLNLIHQNDQLLLRDCGYRNDLDLHSTIIRWVAKSTGEAKWPPAPVQFGHWPSHGSEIFCSSSRRVRGV